MTFSPEWDREFKAGKHLSRFPWTDLVSFVNRYTDLKQPVSNVLELGCGVGTNVPIFTDKGVRYYGVDGSDHAIKICNERFGHLARLARADFTKDIPFQGPFDLIFDRAALTHNDTESIKRCIGLIKERLKPDGKFIGIDWFSTYHDGYDRKRDTVVVDDLTYTDFKDGPFKDIGKVHFSDRVHLDFELFKDFNFEVLEHKTIRRDIPYKGYTMASWNFVCSLKE